MIDKRITLEPDRKEAEFMPRAGYPVVRYHGTDVQVLVGDHVEFKGLLFWRGWQRGLIDHVPGLSEQDERFEHNRIMMVGIRDAKGSRSGHTVEPASGALRENVRFLGRREDANT